MKKLISLALCALLSLAAIAASSPSVRIDNASNVYVDGVNVGAAADAIANNPALAPVIQVALTTFVAKTASDAQSEKAEAVASTAAAKDEQLAAAAAHIAALQSQVRSLGAEPVAPPSK